MMKQLILNVPDEHYEALLQAIEPFNVVVKDELTTYEQLKPAFEELNLIKKGKVKASPIQELWDEL
jgi:hypothetical protein